MKSRAIVPIELAEDFCYNATKTPLIDEWLQIEHYINSRKGILKFTSRYVCGGKNEWNFEERVREGVRACVSEQS